MSLKTYNGSCHCGRVRFEADIDLDRGTGKCNCSICTKSRYWGVILKPDAFRLLAGEEALSDYQWGRRVGHRLFCQSCGVTSFGRGYVEQIGGDYVSVALSCLDDLDPSVLAEGPVRYMDGRHDRWFETPSETRHLKGSSLHARAAAAWRPVGLLISWRRRCTWRSCCRPG